MLEEFTKQAARYNNMNLERIEKCAGMLSQDQLWHSPNENTNSIGNLILHLNGNISQYILSGLGEAIDTRKRDEEFLPNQEIATDKLLNSLRITIQNSSSVINNLDRRKLNSEYVLQGFKMTGMEAVLHVTEHLSYHTGQIALLTKLIINRDLGFYSGKDLNARNT